MPDLCYVFDIDGTLTPSRGQIDSEFAIWFKAFMQTHRVCFVTGSDRDKTVEQVGEELFNLAEYSFNCAGNEIYHYGKPAHTSNWIIPEDAHEWLAQRLTSSTYNTRTGNHFEHRPGMVNFSIVGRNANKEERAEYVVHDELSDERNIIANAFNTRFPELLAQVGGETGIDIFPKGLDKSQILVWFPRDSQFEFYGDRMDPDGNDYALAEAIVERGIGKCYNVKSWKETWELLTNA